MNRTISSALRGSVVEEEVELTTIELVPGLPHDRAADRGLGL